ncbi:hypothetical protein DJ69_12260 [Halorubrum persicum]|uniref:Uncharacterized protein n=1 Tax=Halorubrum persicum TaxID=1383844 RepID=A0A2G1WHK8_9EURY|nr:hypothetical protein [Halorubrum persicum]PHQ38329.1 hypothetical protein DJ69_12260 [Halorubrum persicum]
MTDDEDGSAPDGSTADASPADAQPHAPGTADAAATADAADSPDSADAPIDFGTLSLPQRAFVAAVQNPTRGVMIAGLLAFAFSFYVAFWLVFPQVAAFMSAIGAVLVALVALVYLVSDRLSR